MARLFISQERLDAWSEEDRVKVENNIMTLLGDGRSFRLFPAVRFMKVSGGDQDPNNLLGKVRPIDELVSDGGEHYMNSVILGETAYDVEQGFMGTVVGREGP